MGCINCSDNCSDLYVTKEIEIEEYKEEDKHHIIVILVSAKSLLSNQLRISNLKTINKNTNTNSYLNEYEISKFDIIEQLKITAKQLKPHVILQAIKNSNPNYKVFINGFCTFERGETSPLYRRINILKVDNSDVVSKIEENNHLINSSKNSSFSLIDIKSKSVVNSYFCNSSYCNNSNKLSSYSDTTNVNSPYTEKSKDNANNQIINKFLCENCLKIKDINNEFYNSNNNNKDNMLKEGNIYYLFIDVPNDILLETTIIENKNNLSINNSANRYKKLQFNWKRNKLSTNNSNNFSNDNQDTYASKNLNDPNNSNSKRGTFRYTVNSMYTIKEVDSFNTSTFNLSLNNYGG